MADENSVLLTRLQVDKSTATLVQNQSRCPHLRGPGVRCFQLVKCPRDSGMNSSVRPMRFNERETILCGLASPLSVDGIGKPEMWRVRINCDDFPANVKPIIAVR